VLYRDSHSSAVDRKASCPLVRSSFLSTWQAAEKPEDAKGTKAQSRTKSVITTVYSFVLLRVFVPLWLFQHPAGGRRWATTGLGPVALRLLAPTNLQPQRQGKKIAW